MLKKILMGAVFVGSITATLTNAQVWDPTALNADPKTATGPLSPKLSGLGDYKFAVTTDNAESQYFFDQGFRLWVGFNHSEAMRSFKEAIRLDPDNAMAYWGWALSLGRNLNLPMLVNSKEQANYAIGMALSLKDKVSEREADYIDALAARYSTDLSIPNEVLDEAYVVAMEKLMNKYPDDPDASVLFAGAAMNAQPWDYWNLDGSTKGRTEQVIDALEKVLEKHPNHAAAMHYHIHISESMRPEIAEGSADNLAPQLPGAGHLIHMPSHIFMRVGRYQDAYDINIEAAKVDENYIAQCNAQGLYPLAYYPHNLHFLAWSSMYTGRSGESIAAAWKVKDRVEAGSRSNTWGLNETFRSQPIFVMTRFGMWDELLKVEKPFMRAQFMTGIWHYGRALAHLHKGNMSEAEKEMASLSSLVDKMTEGQPGYSNFEDAGGLLTIALQVVEGEMASKKGDYDKAVFHLSSAARMEDSLAYNEPPSWYFPTRHILGAILLDAGRPVEAEVVYWDDLKHNPENAYSLYGIYQALTAQKKDALAEEFMNRYNKMWANSDVKLTSSRF
jgi:tetratricopeptide (TPR) repeat protein